MKNTLTFVFLGVAAMAATIALRQRATFAPPVPPVSTVYESAAGLIVDSAAPEQPSASDARAEVRTKVEENGAGTYIDDILLDRDSALARWPDRPDRPLKVWIQPKAAIPDWKPVFVEEVKVAFMTWDSLRLPLHFAFVADSGTADIHVTWLDHFNEPISGRTRWSRDEQWWITDASIVIAVHHQTGQALDADAIRAISLHEVGHLIGLDHTKNPDAIMAPQVRARSLTPMDRATARLIYSLPPGQLK